MRITGVVRRLYKDHESHRLQSLLLRLLHYDPRHSVRKISNNMLVCSMKNLLATSLLLAGCSSHPTLPRQVQPAVNITDVDILQYALTLEHLGKFNSLHECSSSSAFQDKSLMHLRG